MDGFYREYPVPPHLAPYAECFWSVQPEKNVSEYAVLPDGCVDIVYSPGRAQEPQVVGVMTRARRFALSAGTFECGIRFRPGMSAAFLRVPASQTTDRSFPLGDGCRVRLSGASSPEECFRMIGEQLRDPAESGLVQQVCAFIVAQRGQVRMDDLTLAAGLSARQLRRRFLDQTGLSPKHFSRLIRFRHSVSQLQRSRRGDWTGLALDSGYYDQAHFINEFREFSGYTPGEFTSLAR